MRRADRTASPARVSGEFACRSISNATNGETDIIPPRSDRPSTIHFRSCRPAKSAYPLGVTKRPNADETFDAFAFRPFRLPRGGVHRGGPGGSPRANSRAVELDGAAGSQRHD